MTLVETHDPSELCFFPRLVNQRTATDSAERTPEAAIGMFESLDRLRVASRIVGSWCESFYLRKDAAAAIQRSTVYATMCKWFRADCANGGAACKWCSGYLEAHAYLRRKCWRPRGSLTIANLLEAHRRLFAGQMLGRKMAGYLRSDAVPAADVAAYGARYQPPQGDELLAAVEKLMAFRWSGDLAPVDRVAITHGELTLLRPFQVGNRRVARLLTSVLLEKWALILPVLDLNGILRQRRVEYEQRLEAVAARKDWRNWVGFFQSCVTDGAEASAQAIFEVTRLVAERRDRLVSNKKTGMPAVRLEALLRFHPVITVSYAAKLLGVSVPTAKNAIGTLTACKILKETTGRRRDKEFADREFLEILTAEYS